MVFMVVKIQVKVFWVVTPCSVVAEYQCLGPCFLHLQGDVTPEDGGWNLHSFKNFKSQINCTLN